MTHIIIKKSRSDTGRAREVAKERSSRSSFNKQTALRNAMTATGKEFKKYHEKRGTEVSHRQVENFVKAVAENRDKKFGKS